MMKMYDRMGSNTNWIEEIHDDKRNEAPGTNDMAMTNEVETIRRTRLTPEREAQLFRTILDLLVEEGYDNLTMDTIATRTHTSKATLYRQWQSKPRLVAATLRCFKQGDAKPIDTGSLCGDMRALARRMGSSAGHEIAGLFWSMADTVRRNPDLREALNEVLMEPARRELNEILQRAIERGEIGPGIPSVDFVQCTMAGAVLSHSVIEGREADSDYMLRYVDAVILPVLGLTPPNDSASGAGPSRQASTSVIRLGAAS